MNGLYWLWHQRAALRVRASMQRHNIRANRGYPGCQGHASGYQRPRSQEVPEPPRQTARHDSPRRHQGPPPGAGSPSGTHRSPLRPFAPQWDRGSPHAAGMRGERPPRGRQMGTRKQGTLTDPGAAAARHPPRRGELYSTGVRTEAVEAPTTRRPDRHHLPPIPGASPTGCAPSGRTSPPFPRRPSDCNRQRFTRAPSRQQTVHPARPPPPSQRHWLIRRRGDRTPQTCGQGDTQQTSNPNRGRGDKPLKATPSLPAGRDTTSPGHGHLPPDQPGQCATRLPTLAVTQPNHSDVRTHHNSGGTAQATRQRTKK